MIQTSIEIETRHSKLKRNRPPLSEDQQLNGVKHNLKPRMMPLHRVHEEGERIHSEWFVARLRIVSKTDRALHWILCCGPVFSCGGSTASVMRSARMYIARFPQYPPVRHMMYAASLEHWARRMDAPAVWRHHCLVHRTSHSYVVQGPFPHELANGQVYLAGRLYCLDDSDLTNGCHFVRVRKPFF